MRKPTARSATSVGAGILLSRVTGFARDLVIAHFFGTGIAAGAYAAALKIPNLIRNLLGEGTLSAAFVPVYSAMLGGEEGEPGDAARLARSVLGLLLVLAGAFSGLGILLAPWITPLVAPGYGAAASALTTGLVRILFPMAGLMILAAWCLGVLNSHRRFFLPFVAPVAWNLAQIGGLLLGAWAGWEPLIYVLAWATLIGAALQLAVQVPTARRLAGSLRPALETVWKPVRKVARNAGPVITTQGIFQVSSFMDVFLGSLVSADGAAVAGIYYAQRIAYLPLSLFGVSIAASELPEMSRERAAAALRGRLGRGFFRILYFVLPSALAFLVVGDLVVQTLFERGQFGEASTTLVTAILAAYAVGLVAASSVKLFAGGFHALQDTRTPMRYAAVAVGVGTGLGAVLMLWMKAAGWGNLAAAGLALGGATGSWLNLGLLWHGLGRRIGPIFGREALLATLRLGLAGLAAVGAGLAARHGLAGWLGGQEAWRGVAVLAGTLVAAGVPYLAIARRPPAPRDPSPDSAPP